MRKIPTLFNRDPENMSRVLNEVNPAAAWVLEGWGTPTRKFDGTCTMLDVDGRWWARREVKPGKNPPAGFRPEETDPNTGKIVGWEPIEQSPFFKAWDEAQAFTSFAPGTYELCGPKVNGNPEGFNRHFLLRHGSVALLEVPLGFHDLQAYLTDPTFKYEGIVWHHPDGRMAKLKRRDFGHG